MRSQRDDTLTVDEQPGSPDAAATLVPSPQRLANLDRIEGLQRPLTRKDLVATLEGQRTMLTRCLERRFQSPTVTAGRRFMNRYAGREEEDHTVNHRSGHHLNVF